ncbi:hypothetical protein N656DRAFT_785388 [Canariomyces notabilis]|uniref:Uncharacterized protein n=1 Tax=Canariomyces notabilis TaxID=2074819 RepID=A0AAN6QBX0_9PEZI|nr:hypothetical protein N656DRAFT_785388 [Canariomyces arenarius]
MTPATNLTIPLKLDAFVFNQKVCDGGPRDAKIAPITQPNYTFLRLEDSLIQNDILNHVDLHNAIPATSNSRLVDLGRDGAVRTNRLGVYLHWTIPRFYRSGVAATPSAETKHAQERRKKGFGVTDPSGTGADLSSPEFPQLPNRWLVIRKLDPRAATTQPAGAEIDAVTAWVVESDRIRYIDDDELDGKDLQVDVSPFITSKSSDPTDPTKISLAEQAEVFIGYKTAARGWTETPGLDRADLSVVSASNHLFADYQPHCSNVFSVLDDFACTINGQPGHLTSAEASYYVLGWHSDSANDPLGNLDPHGDVTRGERIQSRSMGLNGTGPYPPDVQAWLDSKSPARVLCHGAMYTVHWTANSLPLKVPANDVAKTLLDDMPVAVGTTPMDALLAYIDAHQITDLEKDLHLLEPLLRARDDGVQAQRAAVDQLQSWNFARTAGGVHWYFQNETGKEAQDPLSAEVESLEVLNHAQRLADSTARQLVEVRWEMFSEWWQFACLSEDERKSVAVETKKRTDKLSTRFATLKTLLDAEQAIVAEMSQDKTKFSKLPAPGVDPEFAEARDPTLLVGGIQAGWPDDYLDTLQVRLDSQVIRPTAPMPPGDMTPYCADVLPPGLKETATALVREFIALNPAAVAHPVLREEACAVGENDKPGRKSIEDPDPGTFFPLYHDLGKHGDPKGPLRDQWGESQPWFPLFLEWEAEYFHIPWDDWELNGELKDQVDKRWKLGIRDGLDLAKADITDRRTLSGRILLLPQPNFSLQAAVQDLFSNTDPEILNKYLPDPAQRDLVRNDTYQLPFLSAPLDGFSSELVTLMKGTHIKPNARFPQTGYQVQGIQPLPDAKIAPFGTAELCIIDAQSEQTPFGRLVLFHTPSSGEKGAGLKGSNKGKGVDDEDDAPIPFKPARHGQFRFSKLNIVDKFGQAISAIDPRYGHEHEEAVYPCLSRYFAPQLLGGQPNIVQPPARPGHCEFAQVPPAINQPARLNCAFVKHDTRWDTDKTSYSYWRPVTEWETPVWGWVVLNYADYGIQIFLPDGTFYREVRLASPTAPRHTSTGAKWLPFDPPAEPPQTGQLDLLIERLTAPDQKYLLSFLAMLGGSLDASTASSAPSAYGTFLNSLVGRPMALVNAAWSLELATDARKDQSALDGHEHKKQETSLLDGGDGKTVYKFPLKIGDQSRAHDGFVGYFLAKEDPKPGDELDLDTAYTYYPDPAPGAGTSTQPIGPGNYPHLSAFWLKPDDYTPPKAKDPSLAARYHTRDWNSHLSVFGLLIDPFVPVTSFTGGLLPTGSLPLPPWTWQGALARMTAFFHAGPLVVVGDVQKYWNADPSKVLKSQYTLDPPDKDQTVKESKVGIPGLAVANWAWLQPFWDTSNGGEKGKGKQEYMALGLGKVDGRPGYQKGPYTAIEGYLQLKAPIVRSG